MQIETRNKFFLALILFCFFGCDKAIQEPAKEVYIAGYSYDSNGKQTAMYWKNGVPSVLDGGTEANDVYVKNNDVYAVGVGSESGKQIVKLWKNGISQNISDANKNHKAQKIMVVNNDVYILGDQQLDYLTNDERGVKIVYWKNGNPYPVNSGTSYAHGTDMFIDNGDVYVCGVENGLSKYWKNGKETLIDNADYVHGISVYKNDVFVIGTGYPKNNRYRESILWKNGNQNSLTNGTFNCVSALIAIDQANIYYLVSEQDSNNPKGGYKIKQWKNGIESLVEQGDGSWSARDIFISNDDVYLLEGFYPQYKYSVNGISHLLGSKSIGLSIFVK